MVAVKRVERLPRPRVFNWLLRKVCDCRREGRAAKRRLNEASYNARHPCSRPCLPDVHPQTESSRAHSPLATGGSVKRFAYGAALYCHQRLLLGL